MIRHSMDPIIATIIIQQTCTNEKASLASLPGPKCPFLLHASGHYNRSGSFDVTNLPMTILTSINLVIMFKSFCAKLNYLYIHLSRMLIRESRFCERLYLIELTNGMVFKSDCCLFNLASIIKQMSEII